jgi:hypothetical protein
MAETRALARAFRVAVNIGEVSCEEIGGDISAEVTEPAPMREPALARTDRPAPDGPGDDTAKSADRRDAPPPRFRGRDTSPETALPNERRAMSNEQKKLVYRLCFDLGFSRDNVHEKVLKTLGVERLEWATRVHASSAIDALRHELEERRAMQGSNGSSNGRSNGHGAHGGAA